jgi:hypothetical protein
MSMTRFMIIVTGVVKSSRVSSAVKSPSSSQRVKSAGWRPSSQYPRCLTAGPCEIASRYQIAESAKKIQRPKTVSKLKFMFLLSNYAIHKLAGYDIRM